MGEHVLPNFFQHALEERIDALAGDERHLDVDLRELHLTVAAEILVAKAPGDLEIFFDARNHEDLLELLGRLRERVELARPDARRHEVFARALGRALEQRRRLDLNEALRVEVVAHGLGRAVALEEILAHLRPAQVEVTVSQAQVLGDFVAAGVVEREWRRVGNVVDGEFACADLDGTGGQAGVHHTGGTREHDARDADDGLGLELRGALDEFSGDFGGIEFHLRQTLAVAEVEKDDATEIAVRADPAEQRDSCAGVGIGELGAMMGAFHGVGTSNQTTRAPAAQTEFGSR